MIQYTGLFQYEDSEDMPVKPAIKLEKEQRPPHSPEVFRYISFGSGSSGNACFIGTSQGGIIIDAGVPVDKIESVLRSYGIPMEKVKAVLLTHDHHDHVRYVYKLLRTNKHLRLACTPRVLNGLLRRSSVSRRIKDYHVPIYKEHPFKVLNMEITAFDVPHDGSDNMGFSIVCDDKRFVLATDLGEIQERTRHYFSMANFAVIEANYDKEMLRAGRYPEYLKTRISTSNGHMDNADTAAFITELMALKQLRYAFLCHLSEENNTPEKAHAAVSNALEKAGYSVGGEVENLFDREADIRLAVLPRLTHSRIFYLR